MSALREIIKAFDVEKVSETYKGDVEITDLKDELGTKGHVLVVRGDKAYTDKLKQANLPANLANPKFWLYENLINSERIQEELKKHPNHKLFDGVGFSGLEALGWHSKRLGKKAVAVMAHEFLPDKNVFERYDIEVVHGEGPAEQGYVEKQKEILKKRTDIIPLHQALYGASAIAQVGNKVAKKLEQIGIEPDATFWCIASGSNLYGIGKKIQQKFSKCKTVVVEPEVTATIPYDLNLNDCKKVKEFAKKNLRNYSLDDWVTKGRKGSGAWPLHARHPNMYLLRLWAHTGEIGFNGPIHLPTTEINATQARIRKLSPDYNWTKTTALTLNPAIKLAEEGKNVLVMAYGKHREHQYRDIVVNGEK